MHLPPRCGSAGVQRSTSSSVYQTASKCPAEVSDAPDLWGWLHFFSLPWQRGDTHTLRPGPGRKGICTNVIFIAAAIILWDYPCQDNFGVSYLREAAAASLNLWRTTEMFTLSQDGCVVF